MSIEELLSMDNEGEGMEEAKMRKGVKLQIKESKSEKY